MRVLGMVKLEDIIQTGQFFVNDFQRLLPAKESIYIKRYHCGTKKKTIFKAPPSPFQYLGRAWGESKGPIGTFQDLYVAPKGAFECLFGGLELIKCAVYL